MRERSYDKRQLCSEGGHRVRHLLENQLHTIDIGARAPLLRCPSLLSTANRPAGRANPEPRHPAGIRAAGRARGSHVGPLGGWRRCLCPALPLMHFPLHRADRLRCARTAVAPGSRLVDASAALRRRAQHRFVGGLTTSRAGRTSGGRRAPLARTRRISTGPCHPEGHPSSSFSHERWRDAGHQSSRVGIFEGRPHDVSSIGCARGDVSRPLVARMADRDGMSFRAEARKGRRRGVPSLRSR